MEGISPVRAYHVYIEKGEVSDSISFFYEKLKNASANLTTFGFPIESELGELVDILKTRLERAIKDKSLNFRTVTLLNYHQEELARLFEKSSVEMTDAFRELSKAISDQIEVIYPSETNKLDYNLFPEAFIIGALKEIYNCTDPDIPFENKTYYPLLNAIHTAIETFFHFISEFEEIERHILTKGLQKVFHRHQVALYEKIDQGPFPYTLDAWEHQIFSDLQSGALPPDDPSQFLILEIYKILFFSHNPSYKLTIPPDILVYNSMRLLAFNVQARLFPNALGLAKQVTLLQGMADRISPMDPYALRRLSLIQILSTELEILSSGSRIPLSKEFYKMGECLSERLCDTRIGLTKDRLPPEDRIDETFKEFAKQKIHLINRTELEEIGLPYLHKILEDTIIFKGSLKHHIPHERPLFYIMIQHIFFNNISLIYSKWLCTDFKFSIDEFREKISIELGLDTKKTTATIIALKILTLVFFPEKEED